MVGQTCSTGGAMKEAGGDFPTIYMLKNALMQMNLSKSKVIQLIAFLERWLRIVYDGEKNSDRHSISDDCEQDLSM